jgi:long-chain acyl-CoA synthetase
MDFSSLNAMFRWRVERSRSDTAIKQKSNGKWVDITWNLYYESVRFLAQGLHALGVEKSTRVAIFSKTRVEWVFADMAVLGCGGVVVPVYQSSPTRDVEYIVSHSDSKIIIVENQKLLDKVLAARENLSNLTHIILIDGPPPDEDDGIMLMSEVIELGRRQEVGLYERTSETVGLEDIATIVYTSTSGPQKGAVHSHSQLLHQQMAIQAAIGARDDEITLLFLPLAHIFGRVVAYWNISSGITLAFAESYERLVANMREINPHIVAAVPRVFQKIYSSVMREVDSQGGAKRVTLEWCLRVGRKVAELRQGRHPIPLALNAQYVAAKKLFFDRLGQQFGTRIKFFVSSGAPLPKDIGLFFLDAGYIILEAYGLTEAAGAVTMNTLGDFRMGTVGKPLSGTEIDLAPDGEILVKGPTIMNEYWKDPEGTQEALKNGWLYTGDVGETDEDGFLKITERKKAIIITSHGKNISPLNIENHMRSDPYIDQVFLHGDQRNFLSALVTLNRESITRWAEEKGIPFRDYADLTRKPEVTRLIEERIMQKNQDLAGPETIKKFLILDHSFSVDGGELTTTLKLNRRLLEHKYRDILDMFYT